MKKIILLATALLVAGIATAQPKKGAIAVGGSIGFSVNSQSQGGFSTSDNTFTISPSVEYFVSDKLSVGGGISFSSGDEWSIALGAVYYIPLVDKLYFSVGGEIFFGGANNANIFGIGFVPALNYFLTNHISFSFQLGWLGFTSVSGNGASATSFGLSASTVNPAIGISYTF